MKQAIKTILTRLPGGISFLEKLRFKDSEDLFTYYYDRNIWGDQESVSGSHSTIKYTENIRKELPLLIDKLGVKRILDAPCGDYNWFRLVPRSKDIHYVGADIVKALVVHNQEVFGSENTSFIQLDVTNDELPNADLWICRDCLFHFSSNNIWWSIRNLLTSNIRYLLTTTYPESNQNIDIPTGGFRFLNLEVPPFSFCKPTLTIDDWIQGYPVKKLALWERKELLEALVSNKALKRRAKPRR